MDMEHHKSEFDQKGFTIVRGFVDQSVARVLKEISVKDEAMNQNTHDVLDSDGRKSKLTLWYMPGDDVFGRLSCSDKMNEMMATLLGGEVSFFHAKLMNKEPKVGGKWEWHQDYGYWYEDGFLKPDMGSCFIALDPCTPHNGALRVIPCSHQYGRLRHTSTGQQAGAELERVEEIKSRHGEVLCEMEPGDALFFHANALHTSGPNQSDQSRLILISSFFRRDNVCLKNDPRYNNKDISVIDHQKILEGKHQLDPTLNFSRAQDHIIG